MSITLIISCLLTSFHAFAIDSYGSLQERNNSLFQSESPAYELAGQNTSPFLTGLIEEGEEPEGTITINNSVPDSLIFLFLLSGIYFFVRIRKDIISLYKNRKTGRGMIL